MFKDLEIHLQRDGFIPFTLHLADQRKFTVERPELALLTKSTMILKTADSESYDIIRLFMITSIDVHKITPRHAKAA